MNAIAKKIYKTTLIGGLLVFAVNFGLCNISDAATKVSKCNISVTNERMSKVKLNSHEFWNKFRESVMKERDEKDEPNTEPPPSENVPKEPSSDLED